MQNYKQGYFSVFFHFGKQKALPRQLARQSLLILVA